MQDFLRPGRKWTDPAALLAEIVASYPNDRGKQRRVFEAMAYGENVLLHACIEHVFDHFTAPPK